MDSTAILVASIAGVTSVIGTIGAIYIAIKNNQATNQRIAVEASERTKAEAEEKVEDVLRERLTLRDETVAALLKDLAAAEEALHSCRTAAEEDRRNLVTQVAVLNAALDDCLDQGHDGDETTQGQSAP